MTNQEIFNALADVKNGRYISLQKRKDLGEGIIKETAMVIRLGVNYSNMNINAEKETGSLPWGQWVEGLENLVIEHKGNYYLRITSTDPEHPESGADVVATRYLKDEAPISKDEVISLVGSKKVDGKASPVYNIKFENIVALGVNN